MPEPIGTPVPLTMKQSIARVELFTDAVRPQGDWWLTVHFEDGLYDASDTLVGTTQFGSRRVDRRFADMAVEEVTVEGTTLTIAQIAQFVAAGSYKLRQQDIDRAAAAEAAAAQQPEIQPPLLETST